MPKRPVFPEAIALTLVAALPAFFNLATERIFEEEKALLLRAAAVLALPGILFAWRAYLAPIWRHPVVIAFAALILMLLVAALAGVDPRAAMAGAYLKRHGMITWFALAIAFVAICRTAGSIAGRQRLLDAIVIGSIWPSLYALLQRAGADPIQWVGADAARAVSTLGSPNFLGGYLAIVIPLTVLRARSTRWLAVLLPLQLAAVAATASRGASVAIAAGTLLGGIAYVWQEKGGRVLAAGVLVAGLAATTVLVAFPAARPELLDSFLGAGSGSSRVRVLIWKGVLDLERASGGRRWIGYGPESLREIFPPFYSPEVGVLEGDQMPDRAHSEALDMLVGAGVLGLVFELGFFAAIIATAFRAKDSWTRAALVAAASAHIVEIQLGIATVVSRLVFLAVAAMAVGFTEDSVPREAAPALSRAGARKKGHAPPKIDVAAADNTWLWLSVAALAGALSPWMATLTTPGVLSPMAGTESQLVDYLSRLAFVTPSLYVVLLAAAFALSRSMAPRSRETTTNWWLLAATLGGAAIAIPLAITPSRADVFSKAATQFESRQQWTEAVVAYREAVRVQPSEAYYLAGLGRALLQESVRLEPSARDARLRASRDAFERARALDPSDLDHTRHLASLARVEASMRPERRDAPLAEADRLYAEATARAPGLTPLWIEWAWVDFDRQRLPQALDKVDHAIALGHDRVDAWVLRGHIHAAQSKPKEALADYDAALLRQVDNVDAKRGRAAVLAAVK